MAATDKPYRNQKTLDIVFAVSSILMLLSVVWMLVVDYNRPFKAEQRVFRDVESVLNERQMLAAMPEPNDVKAAQKAVAETTKAVDDVKAKVHPDDQRITAELDLATADYRSDKADLDSLSSLLDIAGAERDQAGISREVRRERTERYEALNKTVEAKRNKVTADQDKVDKISEEYKSKVTEPVTRAQNELADAQDALKKLSGNFDRFAKQTVQKEWGFGDAFRSLPILDAFESPTKIKQIVLNDLPIEYGSFKYVTRYDRCTSCHLAVDRAGFDRRTLIKLTRSENDARDARRAAVKAACNDILAGVGAVLAKDEHDKLRDQLAALESAVDKGDVVTRVEARAPGSPAPPPATPETTTGKATKVEKDRITVQAGDDPETTFAVPADAVVTIDGAADKLESVPAGSLVTVLKGDDADPFRVIGGILGKFRDPDTYGPEIVTAVSEPTIQADLVRVKEENEDFREAQSLPRKLELARRNLQERKDKGETLGFEPGDLPSHARTVALTPGQVTQFATHPRLDLFVDSNSPHPMEKFGCTICHAGQGSATDFQLAAHTPDDARRTKDWEGAYHWHATHDWEFPMLANRFTESSCLKCHHEVTDLVRQGNKEEAPKLLRGFNLVRENGCFGCHEIAGIKSGREVGPDLRLEPAPALDWLSPTDQDKAKADPTNPPGTYRKVGPSLRRIAEKTNEKWARRWIQSPRGFRPDTKMPHFYNLSNDSPDGSDALPDDQKDFPAAEIHSIAHYLFAESSAHLQGADTYRVALEERLQELQDRLAYSPLEDKDRKELAETVHKLADLGLLSAPVRAAKINGLAASLRDTQDQLLERYPKQADLELKIVDLETRVVKQLNADLAEDGNEDPALAKDMDGLTQEFTKQADRSIVLARKYLTGIEADEAAELVSGWGKPKDLPVVAANGWGLSASPLGQSPLLTAFALVGGRQPGEEEKRDLAFVDLLARAPILPKRFVDPQKEENDLLRMLDAPKQAAADARDRVQKAADAKAKAEEQTGLDKAKAALAKVTADIIPALEGPNNELVQVMDQARQDLGAQRADLEEAGKPIPILARVPKPDKKDEFDFRPQIVNAEGEPVRPDDVVTPDKTSLAAGRRLFSERGCLACHVHDGVRQKGTNPGDPPALPDAAANFAPDLSRVAAKIAPNTGDKKEDATARRLWVVQWVLNPNIYHPRTRMPITHLSVPEACDVADWLLSQEPPPDALADWPEDPQKPDAKTLVDLARVYLAKAPGMTSGQMDKILPGGDDLARAPGYSAQDLGNIARDADERLLQGPITEDKLERYVGKKAIGRLGCYGCHDLPGFETAKPIGTTLNDWGKKDPERLAFEDGDAYVRDHYNIVDARYDAADKNRPNPDFCSRAGKEPYEQAFYDALEHHEREGFLHQKLTEPRSYDYHRIRAWDDRLRMPQFRFARSRPRPGEPEEAYAARQEREEAEAREAVMTFILGLQAEPIPQKYVHTPGPDRLAEAQGRKVLEKYNCIGCHQVRPGVYELRPGKETLASLEQSFQTYAGHNAAGDHVFAGHNAWTGLPSPWPDRLVAYGTQEHVQTDEKTGRDVLNVRLTDALHFTNNDRIARDLPAGERANVPPEEVFSQSPPFGGALGDLLVPYLKQDDSTVFGDPNTARAVLPPPLVREGERVQPKWLYPFLLNPGVIRPQEKWMRLRMPKFNMSPDEAMTLVNYFGAADKLGNPGAGLTYPYLKIDQSDDQFWRDQTAAYLERLKQLGGPDGKGLQERAKALLTQMRGEAQKRLDRVKSEAAAAQGDEKARKEQEAKSVQDMMDKWDKQLKDGDLTDLVNLWKEGAPESKQAYAADAYRLVANPTICMNCHSVGALKIQGAKGPDLLLSAERLRPEWTLEWVGNPKRMFTYDTIMPQNFPNDQKTNFNDYFVGQPIDRVRAARDLLMDLPELEKLPANRATQTTITGGK